MESLVETMTAILFDLDDTLYDQLVPFQQALEQSFQVPAEAVEGLYKQNRKHSDRLFQKVERGEISKEAMQLGRIQRAMAAFGQPISEKQAAQFQKEYEYYQTKIVMTPNMTALLQFCQQNALATGLITNGPKEHQWQKIQQLGLLKWIEKENIFISGELGVIKPEKSIFSYAQKQMKLQPTTTYYVGDSFANDVLGAGNAKWQPVWLNRRKYHAQSVPFTYYEVANDNELRQFFNKFKQK